MARVLKQMIEDWTDMDGAQYALALSLGLMDESVNICTDAKHVFWTDNPIVSLLDRMLDDMVSVGILLKRSEPDFQYRWNPHFRGSWEGRQMGLR